MSSQKQHLVILKHIEELLATETDECIQWPFSRTIKYNGHRPEVVYRIVCRLKHGNAPCAKDEAIHSCRTKFCVNHRHVRWGSHKENMAEMNKDGTSRRGTKAYTNRLTEDHIHWIRHQFGLRISVKRIAEYLEMSQEAIYDIYYNRHWNWLVSPDPYIQKWESLEIASVKIKQLHPP